MRWERINGKRYFYQMALATMQHLFTYLKPESRKLKSLGSKNEIPQFFAIQNSSSSSGEDPLRIDAARVWIREERRVLKSRCQRGNESQEGDGWVRILHLPQ